MKLVSYKDVTYRDMPYKMVMTNASGDTAFLYDVNKHMSIMTPFKFDEKKIENPELLVSMDELVDNLIHGDIHQSENYTNIIEKNIEQLGELELEEQDRMYLTEVICTWAKRSKYVQQFTKEFDKIGIDISNILYERDSEYNDLLDACKKSEQKKVEEIKDETPEKENTDELDKQEETNKTEDQKTPEGLDEIDPEMEEEVKKEMNESKPDELKDNKVENDNKENFKTTPVEAAAGPVSAGFAGGAAVGPEVNSARASATTPTAAAAGTTNPVSAGSTSADVKPPETEKKAPSTDPVSEITTNPARLSSEYELIKPYLNPMAELLNKAWISLVSYDVRRTESERQEFYDLLDYAVRHIATFEEAEYLRKTVNNWIQTGGICLQDKDVLSNRFKKIDERISYLSHVNKTEMVFVRDVLLLADEAEKNLDNPGERDKNFALDIASQDYSNIARMIHEMPKEVSQQSRNSILQLATEISEKICNQQVDVNYDKKGYTPTGEFYSIRITLDSVIKLFSNGQARLDEVEYAQWLLERYANLYHSLDPKLFEGKTFTPSIESYISGMRDYLNNIASKFKKQSKNGKTEENEYVDYFLYKYKNLKKILDEYAYNRKRKGINTDSVEELSNYSEDAMKSLRDCEEYMSPEEYRKYEEEIRGILENVEKEKQTLEEFSSMMRRF